MDGFLGAEEIRESLHTRNWDEAQQKVREFKAEGAKPSEPPDNRMTIEAVCDRYLADARSRQLGPAALYKYNLLVRQLKSFATDRGLRFVEEFDLDLPRDFRATWKNHNLSAKRNWNICERSSGSASRARC
jgi:hypothetical protein